jgi:hypothetical protein
MPFSNSPKSLCLLAALTVLIAAPCITLDAQEFRIETEIFVGDETEPVSRTVTLFEESAVYDFSEEPTETVVYRRSVNEKKGQFILLDPQTRQRTDVEVAQIEPLMTKLEDWAGQHGDKLMQFCAEPIFDESYDEETGELLLASKLWTYRAATVPVDEKAASERFREFTDNYVQLNTMLHPDGLLPGPRLSLNRALTLYGVVPVEIRRTINGDEKHQVRASHLFSWRLSREDRSRLDEVRRDLANYKKVDNKAFLSARKRAGGEVVRGQSK